MINKKNNTRVRLFALIALALPLWSVGSFAQKNYDIDEINALLYQKDLSLLGTY
jgi:hypothetical protein